MLGGFSGVMTGSIGHEGRHMTKVLLINIIKTTAVNHKINSQETLLLYYTLYKPISIERVGLHV